jgi:hypothetical protein
MKNNINTNAVGVTDVYDSRQEHSLRYGVVWAGEQRSDASK